MRIPRIALTMGDPAGVGPELVLKALSDSTLSAICRLVVLGDWQVMRRCSQVANLPLPDCPVITPNQFADCGQSHRDNPRLIVDHSLIDMSRFQTGKLQAQCGEAAFRYIHAAIDACQDGSVQAITTAPINKEALHLAGHNYPGHTEIFAQRTASDDRWCMMQYSTAITCTFATVHCGYADVPQLLTVQRILDTIELTAEALQRIRGHRPHLLVCGLNPHAGENGLFGNREEERLIRPAIQAASQKGISVEGPLPADTVFLPSRLAKCDAVVCMYHDQGHIPVKTLAFESAVNTTLGLSIVRTSVDHGTAFDIAWQGIANSGSLLSALRLAAQLA